jgi:excinuclease UvrABC nuclease subunit
MTGWQRFSINHGMLSVPRSPGVYVIYFGGRPAYVGVAGDMKARLKSHRLMNIPGPRMYDGWVQTPWGNIPWDRCRVYGKLKVTENREIACRLEKRLIGKLNPEFNIQGRTK